MIYSCFLFTIIHIFYCECYNIFNNYFIFCKYVLTGNSFDNVESIFNFFYYIKKIKLIRFKKKQLYYNFELFDEIIS
jgi:hypothetical protein